MAHIVKRPSNGSWPWPYVVLKNGTNLEIQEVVRVKCLKEFEGKGGQNVKAHFGQKVLLRHYGMGLELVKYAKGNVRYLTIMQNPEEGVDFETIPSEKLLVENKEARKFAPEYAGM